MLQIHDFVYANKLIHAHILGQFFITKISNFNLILTSESLFSFSTDTLWVQQKKLW